MIDLHQQIEEVDVRTVLAEELSKRGVNPQLADRRARQIAEDFYAYPRALATQTLEVKTQREADLVKQAVTACKRVWLKQRIEAVKLAANQGGANADLVAQMALPRLHH